MLGFEGQMDCERIPLIDLINTYVTSHIDPNPPFFDENI